MGVELDVAHRRLRSPAENDRAGVRVEESHRLRRRDSSMHLLAALMAVLLVVAMGLAFLAG
jgi:hypothetical protein